MIKVTIEGTIDGDADDLQAAIEQINTTMDDLRGIGEFKGTITIPRETTVKL